MLFLQKFYFCQLTAAASSLWPSTHSNMKIPVFKQLKLNIKLIRITQIPQLHSVLFACVTRCVNYIQFLNLILNWTCSCVVQPILSSADKHGLLPVNLFITIQNPAYHLSFPACSFISLFRLYSHFIIRVNHHVVAVSNLYRGPDQFFNCLSCSAWLTLPFPSILFSPVIL